MYISSSSFSLPSHHQNMKSVRVRARLEKPVQQNAWNFTKSVRRRDGDGAAAPSSSDPSAGGGGGGEGGSSSSAPKSKKKFSLFGRRD